MRKSAYIVAIVFILMILCPCAFCAQVLVHISTFNAAGFTNISSEVENPTTRGYIYDNLDGSVKFVLEKPGVMYAWSNVGFPTNQPSVPKMRLYPGDTIRLSYRGSCTDKREHLYANAEFQGVGDGSGSICDGKKRILDVVVPNDGKDYRLDRMYLKINNSGTGGEFVVYDLKVYRDNINNRLDADKILKSAPSVSAIVKKHNGVMTPFVNGRSVSLFGWSHMIPANVDDSAFKTMFGDLQMSCAYVIFNPGYNTETGFFAPAWLGPDHFDWGGLDSNVDRVLKYNSNAYIILQVVLDGSSWWLASHPGARGDKPGTIDMLSTEWQKASRDLLRQMIAHIQTSKYASNVIGYEFFNGPTLDGGFRAELYTKQARKRFTGFLKKRYKTQNALRKAWNNPLVTFETVCPQTRSEDMFNNSYSLFFQAGKYRRAADTEDFAFWESSQINIDFAKAIKDATHGQSLAGSVGIGEFMVGNWGNGTKGLGGSRIKYLTECPYFDYWDRWEPYPGRGLGYWGSGAPMVPVQGLCRMGKLWVLQDDVRPHTGPDFGYGATSNIGETIAKQRRVLLNSVIQGTQPYLWQMNYSYNTDDQKPLWTEQKTILEKAEHFDRSSVAEVAYIYDADYARFCGMDLNRTSPTRGFSILDYPRFLYARAGAPFDMIFLDQIEKLKKYKVYVFSLCWSLSDSQIEMIRKVTSRRGTVSIFLWGDAIINGKGLIDGKLISKLTGMNIQVVPKERSWRMIPSHWFATRTGIPADTPMGTLRYNEPCEPLADRNEYSPYYVVDDPTAKTIAFYEGTKEVGIAEKTKNKSTIVFCGSMNLVPELMRYCLNKCGAFQYTDTDDICYVNKSFIGLHTQRAGNVNIRLPEAQPLYDVYNDRELAKSSKFSISVDAFQTYMFFRGTKQLWLAKENKGADQK